MKLAALWRSLPAPHRRWIVRNALLATALINLVVNAMTDELTTAPPPDAKQRRRRG